MLFGQHFDGEPSRNLNHVFLRQFGNGFNKKIGMFMFKNQNDGATLTIVWARNGASGALLKALLRSSPYCGMAKRAFFLLVLETKTFFSAFKSEQDELDMDVY